MLVNMSMIHDYIESLNIQGGTRYRSDCPSCGHKNSFAAFNDGITSYSNASMLIARERSASVRLSADPQPLHVTVTKNQISLWIHFIFQTHL